MKIIRLLPLLVIALISSLSLASAPEPEPVLGSVPFANGDFEPYLRTGTAKVTGSAFLKTRAGDVKLGAGNVVELIPFVGYMAYRHNMVQRGVSLGQRPSGLAKYVRSTVADGRGEFSFDGLPAGDYVAYCMIQWQYVDRDGVRLPTGGQAFAVFSISEGETKRIIVTR